MESYIIKSLSKFENFEKERQKSEKISPGGPQGKPVHDSFRTRDGPILRVMGNGAVITTDFVEFPHYCKEYPNIEHAGCAPSWMYSGNLVGDGSN